MFRWLWRMRAARKREKKKKEMVFIAGVGPGGLDTTKVFRLRTKPLAACIAGKKRKSRRSIRSRQAKLPLARAFFFLQGRRGLAREALMDRTHGPRGLQPPGDLRATHLGATSATGRTQPSLRAWGASDPASRTGRTRTYTPKAEKEERKSTPGNSRTSNFVVVKFQVKSRFLAESSGSLGVAFSRVDQSAGFALTITVPKEEGEEGRGAEWNWNCKSRDKRPDEKQQVSPDDDERQQTSLVSREKATKSNK